MKIFLIPLLCASLVGNALLFKNRRAASTASSSASVESMATGAKSAIVVPPLSAETWELIKAGDASCVATLRSLGLSDEMLNRVIRARIELRYREREKELFAKVDYWKRNYNTSRSRPVDPLKALDLRREKDAELKALLGADYRKDDEYSDPRTAFLPPGKAEELRLLQEDYDALTQSTYVYDGGIMLPEDREKLAYLEKQKRTDLAALLTPEELAAYDLRNSNTANMLTYQLRDSDFTEEEYKAIFALRKPFDDQYTTSYGMMVTTTPEQSKARQQAEESLNKEIKAALGDERYAAYQRSQDQEYRTLNAVAKRLDLPPAKATEAYALKVSLEQKMKDFRPQPGSSPGEQRNAYLATLIREAETGFTAILGEKGYLTYKENSQLYRRLQPPVPITAPKS
ncbi:MAG: hypothetical protein QM760_05915 [Nibricoccus sp.]